MDYGQSPQLTDEKPEPEFFTAGVGTNSETANNFEPENNLDLSNTQADWTPPSESSQRGLGNIAISSTEYSQTPDMSATPEVPPMMPEFLQNPNKPTSEQIGQIMELTPPPMRSDNSEIEATPYNKSNLKIGESLGKAGVAEVNRIIDSFGDDPNGSYTNYQNMREAALEESYGRIIGEQKA